MKYLLPKPHRGVLAPACLAILSINCHPVAAQTTQPPIVITGNPLGDATVATPTTVLSGSGLLLRRGSSLGETLAGLPGVQASYFGPNASRPVIRGQDGDRIRVLSNAGAALDASGLSFDHAVPIDPLMVERLEVLRGPAALLYGGSAVGGVVNAIDNRIPKAALAGVSGAAEVRLGGAANERAASALLEAGTAGFAWHADAFGRTTQDLKVPAFDRPVEDNGGATQRRTRVVNSASRASGGAVGASLLWAGGAAGTGHIGASVDTYRNRYGIVAEDDVTIHMQRDRLALSAEWQLAQPSSGTAPLHTLRAQAGHTNYQHQEIEGAGTIGTTFKTRGSDLRLEAVHGSWQLGAGRLAGTVGLQWDSSRFSALGEEAFVPSTQTRSTALFVLERWAWGAGHHVSAGLRTERVRVQSAGDADFALNPDAAQFGAAQTRSFAPHSASLGAVLQVAPQWQATASVAMTQRAPTFYELYANGLHAATGAFERGNTQQALEKGNNIDLGLAWRRGAHHAKASLYRSRFANYIALAATGEPDYVDSDGGSAPVFTFQGVRALLQGFEVEGNWRAMEHGGQTLDMDVTLQRVQGTATSNNQPLPRLAPLQAVLGLTWAQGPWQLRGELQRSSAQNRVPKTDTTTAGYTLVHLQASYTLALGPRQALLFAKLQNAGNTLAYSASTVGTVRPLSPLPGRGLTVGARLGF
jgi:iron complex outermembrane recepter protein